MRLRHGIEATKTGSVRLRQGTRLLLTGTMAVAWLGVSVPFALGAPPVNEVASELATPRLPARFPKGSTRWLGSYSCGQGLTRLELIVTRDVQTNDLQARFAFSAHPRQPRVPSGQFAMTGRYDADTGSVVLNPTTWLSRPPNFGMVGLHGQLSADATSLAGRVNVESAEFSPCTSFSVVRVGADDPWPVEVLPPLPPVPEPVAAPRVLVRINGRALTTQDLDAYLTGSTLGHTETLEALIDSVLLRDAVRTHSIEAPQEPWNSADREAIEDRLADRLQIRRLPQLDTLVVDHAWVKDAAQKKINAQHREAIGKLRELLLAKHSLLEAWKILGVDGQAWHIAEKEDYPAPVLPDEAKRLQPGAVSTVIPGDGGLHLFRLIARVPSAEALRARRDILYRQLRARAQIERLAEEEANW